MRAVSAAEFVRRPALYKDAARYEPVAVTSDGVAEVYLLSPAEFECYQQMKRRDRETFSLSELPETAVLAIVSATIDPECEQFNDEVP